MNLSKNAEYTSNLSSDESEGRGHRKHIYCQTNTDNGNISVPKLKNTHLLI
jgi:hypothetical protein